MSIKYLENFYKKHELKIQLENGIPVPMAVSSFCNYGDKNCNQECNLSREECEKFEPNETFKVWQEIEGENIVSVHEIDFNKEYFSEKEPSEMELLNQEIENLKTRISSLESELQELKNK